MQLFLIRHGECLGQCDPSSFSDPDSPLSLRGQQQAQRVAGRLQHEQVTHILSSPLVRSLATASIIADILAIETISVWPDLREGFGNEHRGLGRSELQRRFPRATLPSSITEEGWDHGGDTVYTVFFARAERVLQEMKHQFGPTHHIVIITHGGFANYLLHAILHISSLTPQWFELANCAISEIRLVPEPEKERPNWPLYPPVPTEVLRINDSSHLGHDV